MMATNDALNLLTDCLICELDRSDKSPRQLICKHGFCEECLVRTPSLRIKDNLQCPVCLQHTHLPKDGIRGLPVDSKASKARKAFDAWSGANTCTMCLHRGENNPATCWCKDCEIRLCQGCGERHNKKQPFATHVIVGKLCRVHLRDFTVACLTCRAGLCQDCILSEFHEDHDICDLIKVNERTSDMIAAGKSLLQTEIETLDKQISKSVDSLFLLKERRRNTEEKLEKLSKELFQAIKEGMSKRDETYQQAIKAEVEKQKDSCAQASKCLNDIDRFAKREKLDILDHFVRKTSDVFRALTAVRTTEHGPTKVPEFVDDKCTLTIKPDSRQFRFSCVLGNVMGKSTPHVMSISTPYENKPKRLVFLLKERLSREGSIYFRSLEYITALPDGSGILGEPNSIHVLKVSTKGEITGRYTTKADAHVRGVGVFGDTIYICAKTGNLVVAVSGSTEHKIILQPPVRQQVYDMDVFKDHIILSDNNGHLWKYSTEGDQQRQLPVQGAHRISIGVHPDAGMVYLTTRLYHFVIYTSEGRFIRTIGKQGDQDGQFGWIQGLTMLPNGNILAADSKLHRVSEFTFEGKFIRHLLTQEDDLYNPRDIAFAHPYLWVACNEVAMLFTYE